MSIPANKIGPNLEERVERLEAALARLATEVDLNADGQGQGRMSSEEVVERTLYPEHFTQTAPYRGPIDAEGRPRPGIVDTRDKDLF